MFSFGGGCTLFYFLNKIREGLGSVSQLHMGGGRSHPRASQLINIGPYLSIWGFGSLLKGPGQGSEAVLATFPATSTPSIFLSGF